MKKKISIFAILLVLSMALTFQSCLDREPVPFVEEQAWTIPVLVAPENGSFIDLPATSQVTLEWSYITVLYCQRDLRFEVLLESYWL